ncbi:related to enoyl-CoA-hydratase [Claviceps purpurea 20.1]|uniref:3-hydroxyisobutyryl-CoA hydrolase n=1 Tax=Claviceps purpurea (strain 20.1) TaxID=1111077 RepID=M1WAI7_CLAP2|nr:related to enoyl-CoA-hydratase [Claviceps purpurea 20.1]
MAQSAAQGLSAQATRIKELPDDGVDDVIFASKYGLRTIILNRPKQLNSLNGSMIRKIVPRMIEWEKSDMANIVLLKGAGDRALCAGGDVAALAKLNQEGPNGWKKSADFFALEYKLMHYIATYKKPYVALMDGVTMGGGVGLSMHAPFRIATEKTVFAMPETTIGFFPDVGASFFLPRLNGAMGTYLALTSDRLIGPNVFYSGIATHYLHSTSLPDLEARLAELSFRDDDEMPRKLAVINNTLEEFCTGLPYDQPIQLRGAIRKTIDRCFSKNNVADIVAALKEEATVPVEEQTGATVEGETGTTVEEQTAVAVEEQTDAGSEQQSGVAVEEQTNAAVEEQTDSAVEEQTGAAVEETGAAMEEEFDAASEDEMDVAFLREQRKTAPKKNWKAKTQKWAEKTLSTLQQRSPTAVHVALRQMRLGGDWDIAETFKREHQIASKFMQHPDFTEGVTALLVHKTAPKWKFESLDGVPASENIAQPFFEYNEEKQLQLFTDRTFSEYPHHTYGVPTEKEVEAVVKENSFTRGKIFRTIVASRNGRQGVAEVVNEILRRKTVVDEEGKARWVDDDESPISRL